MNDYHNTASTSATTVSLLYGVKSIDRSGISKWDSKNIGELIYDDQFDLAPEANQLRIVEICNALKSSEIVDNAQVTCWVEDFLNLMNGGNAVPEASFNSTLVAFLQTSVGQAYYSNNKIGYINGTLKFIIIDGVSTVSPGAPMSEFMTAHDKWEKHKDVYNSDSPAGINKAVQTAGWKWAFIATQEESIRGAKVGIALSISFAFIVLILSTHNILISFYSVLCISCIVVSVIGTIQMMGWTFGL